MKRIVLGDKFMGGIVEAMGVKDGEPYLMTVNKSGSVGLWPGIHYEPIPPKKRRRKS